MKPKSKYHYLKEQHKEKLQGFESYLQKLGNGKDTIHHKLNYIAYFFNWMESEHLQPNETTYNDLLNFIDYCKLEEKSIKLINRKLSSIRNYYDFLKKQNENITNPATNLNLKGTKQKLPSNIIDFTTLEKLYQSYETSDNRSKRNKIILGLLIYQAVTTEELKQLEPNHLKLKEGKIYVPGNRRRNSRNLELKPFQILDLYEYQNETRPTILKEIKKPRPARKPDRINKTRLENQLFISISTERYQLNNLDKLQSKLEKYHPLK
jgi:integrase/recombinase XerD